MTPAPSCHFNTMLTTYCYSLQARGIVNNGQRVHGARFVPVAPPLIRVTMSSHVHAGTCVVLVNVCGSYTHSIGHNNGGNKPHLRAALRPSHRCTACRPCTRQPLKHPACQYPSGTHLHGPLPIHWHALGAQMPLAWPPARHVPQDVAPFRRPRVALVMRGENARCASVLSHTCGDTTLVVPRCHAQTATSCAASLARSTAHGRGVVQRERPTHQGFVPQPCG